MGWIAVGLGAILLLVAFGALNSGFGLLALAPAVGIVVGGFLMVAQGQLLQAQIDVAANTAELVNLLRNVQLPKTESMLAQPGAEPTRSAVLSPVSSMPSDTPAARVRQDVSTERKNLVTGREYNSYRGVDIAGVWKRQGWRYRAVGQEFSNLTEAADYIDRIEGGQS
jgi:hypothetical protein